MEAPPSPLSSRAQPRDLRFSQPASALDGSSAVTFVIPSAAEGSAVLSTSICSGWKLRRNLCHPERSRGICSLHSLAKKLKVYSRSTLCHANRSRGICGCSDVRSKSLTPLQTLFAKAFRNFGEGKVRNVGSSLIPPVLENATVTERDELALAEAELMRDCVNPFIRSFELGINA
jgi:hypothetical protein